MMESKRGSRLFYSESFDTTSNTKYSMMLTTINPPCSHTSWSDLVHHGYLERSDFDSGWRNVPSRHTVQT